MLSYDEEDSSGSDSDTEFNEDMEALRRACKTTGVDASVHDPPKSPTADADYDVTYDSEDEDIELLRSINERFSLPTTDIGTEEHLLSTKPLNTILPPGLSDDNDDYGDDFETLRAIQRRFSHYNDSKNTSMESSPKSSEQVGASNIDLEKEPSANFYVKRNNNGQGFPDSVDGRATNQNLDISSNITLDTSDGNVTEGYEPGSELVPVTDCGGFPRSAQSFVDAIKKNRICQKYMRNKLAQVEAKMEELKKLRERVKIMKDFQVACRKRTGRALSQKKDLRIQLISVPKLRSNAKAKDNIPATCQGPAENSHVEYYRDAMSRYSFSLTKEPWSKEEKEKLLKGVKQQFQEILMKNLLSAGNSSNLDSAVGNIKHHTITPKEMRECLPLVNWEKLASMYLPGRSGPECESRWINYEDPLINHERWGIAEDKQLLFLVQNERYSNWIEIAAKLKTNRTPFQCLSRFQRSLNASIIKNEWTRPEDEELRKAVAEYGETNWQLVASTLEGRTGTQCSNRWKKSLNPLRERVGKWAPDEDKRLKITVSLFGAKNWNKIAKFVPGRTQVQCRERWVNCLDPSLNMNQWTPEEDSKLRAAIIEHEYCWSRIAACVPPRTDSQCRRRWKVLLPEEVSKRQAARKLQKAAFISNFVDREGERPSLKVSDFIVCKQIESAPEVNSPTTNNQNEASSPKNKKRKRPLEHCGQASSSRSGVPTIRSRRARKVTHTEKAMRLTDEDDVEDNEDNADVKNKQIISSGDTVFDSNNSEEARSSDGHNNKMKEQATGMLNQKRRRGNKHVEMDETMESDAISNQQTLRANETSIIDPGSCKAEAVRKVVMSGWKEPCSSREITESAGEDVPQVKTPQKGRKASKRPSVTNGGDKPKRSCAKSSIKKGKGSTSESSRGVNGSDYDETLASFLSRVQKRRLEGRKK